MASEPWGRRRAPRKCESLAVRDVESSQALALVRHRQVILPSVRISTHSHAPRERVTESALFVLGAQRSCSDWSMTRPAESEPSLDVCGGECCDLASGLSHLPTVLSATPEPTGMFFSSLTPPSPPPPPQKVGSARRARQVRLH